MFIVDIMQSVNNDNDVVERHTLMVLVVAHFHDLLANEIVNENMVQIFLVDIVDFFGLLVHVRLIDIWFPLLMNVEHVDNLV